MGILGELLYAILRAVLPWLFSGSETTKVITHPGLEGLDRTSLSGTRDLTLKDLPAVLLVGALTVSLTGCALGGATVEHRYHMNEPGSVLEVVDAKRFKQLLENEKTGALKAEADAGPWKVRAPDTNDVGDFDPVGKMIMPKSVYRQLRESWIKDHPDIPAEKPPTTPDTKP